MLQKRKTIVILVDQKVKFEIAIEYVKDESSWIAGECGI
jgi:hypothetical protein